jgi:F-type H+-transporting ATPase subunit b
VKSIGTWVIVFGVLLGLAYGVDHGEVKLGIPVFVWLALNLTVFLYLLARFVGRPVLAFLEMRQDEIKSDLQQAEERLVDAKRLKNEVLERLGKVEAEVEDIQTKAEKFGQEEADRIAIEAQQEAERLLRRVGEEITHREAETRERLEKETAELTARLAREILKKTMTDADRERVMEHSVSALQSMDREV